MSRLNKYYNVIAAAVLILISSVSYAQPDMDQLEENLKNASFKQKFETANSLMEDNLYEFALKIWLNLAEEEPDNANVNYKTGLCYLNTNLERNKALPYLIKANENISKKYDPFSYSEKSAPVETHFYLGKAYHLNEKFDEAIEEYHFFQEEANKKHRLYESSALQIIYSENAKKEIQNRKNFQITNTSSPINSAYSEISPVVTADESAMFFTSRRLRTDSSNAGIYSPQDGKYFEDVYVSYKNMKTGTWGEPELMEFSNPRSNQATISVSADGQFLFIYKDDNGDGNIYVSEREDINYGRLKFMGSDINSKSWETHACVSADGNTLYFVSDRPGGFGGRDIYRCLKLPNGEWSKALNIGAPINTKYDEDSPFFHPDGKTLYFSSNGDNSMGGFDIFFSKKGEDGNWTAPLNIGYPLNSVDDDVFFSTTVDGKKGYYSSAHEGGLGEKDIYNIELDTTVIDQVAILKGYIDAGSEKELPKGIVIWVTDVTVGGDPIQYRPNRRTGSYIFSLEPCHEYEVDYTKQGESFYSTEFKVPCNSDYHVIDKVINLGGIAINEGDSTIKDTSSTVEPDAIDKVKEQWSYQIYLGDKPYYLDGLAEILELDDAEFTEAIEKGKFKYRELKSKKDPIFELSVEDPTLCEQLSIKILDENGKVVKVTSRDIRCKISSEKVEPIVFQKYYGYNEKGVKPEEQRFKEFLEGIEKIIALKGSVNIEIEGSASTVPTRTFGSNKKLATYRSDEAKQLLMAKLKEHGINTSKVKLVAVNSIVQGPGYKGDYKNADKYAKYQYIKMKAF